MPDYNYYNKDLKLRARKLRNNSTKGEIRLWCELLRGRKLRGYQFSRQRPVYNFIADFMCPKLNLIIEVDGTIHNFRKKKDFKRDQLLTGLGFTTLKFTEEEIRWKIEKVKSVLNEYIDIYEEKNKIK
jgi:very-short-patch-repair endonuclease